MANFGGVQVSAEMEPKLVNFRPYRPEDAGKLLALFRDTVRRVNSRDYSPEQIAAWSSDLIDGDLWARRFTGNHVVVAEVGSGGPLAGFAEMEPNGHIDRFYVSADHQGLGIGSQMMAWIEQQARKARLPRLTVEASITARPFFMARGFREILRQTVGCRGVALDNFQMDKNLD